MAKSAESGKVTIDISYKTILFIIGLYGTIQLVFILKNLLLGLFISILFATGLNPLVSYIERLKVPRPVAILLLYVFIAASLILLVGTVLPPLLAQTTSLIQTLPLAALSDDLQSIEVNLENIQFISSQFGGSVTPLIQILASTFSGVVTFFTFAVITFYLLIERKNLHKHIARLSPNIESEHKVDKLINKIEIQIGSWVRGQLILMLVVGVITYVGLSLLNVSFALPLAIIAGMLEIIPNIGPTVASIPAIIVPIIIDQDPLTAVFVIALYVLIQQFENNLLVPRIMQSAVGIHPLVTILLIIIGLELSGVIGAILAVPMYLVSKVFYVEVIHPIVSQRFLPN